MLHKNYLYFYHMLSNHLFSPVVLFFFFNSLYASASFFYRYPEDLIIKSTKSISVCRGSYYGSPGKVSVPFKARNVIHGLVSLPVWIIRFILFIIVFSFAVIIKKDVVIVGAKSISSSFASGWHLYCYLVAYFKYAVGVPNY